MAVNKLLQRVILPLVLVGALIIALPQEAMALNHVGRLYFSGAARSVGGSNCPLISGGYGGGANKDNFINFVKSNWYSPSGGSGCANANVKRVGAAYIIQTMRGLGVGAPLPSAGDVADWEARVRNPQVTISTESIGYGLNTATYWGCGTVGSSCLDVGQYNNSSTQPSTVFRLNGAVLYKLKNSCANPVDNNSAIPLQPQDYYLNPAVTTNRTVGEPGQSTVVSAYVNNTGNVASSNTQWQLSRFVAPSGGSYPGGGNSPAAPAQYYGNNLTRLDGGGGASFQVGNRLIGAPSHILPDVPVGSRVCYAFSVQARAYNDGQWAHSPPMCVIIAKKPKVQILGGDLLVGKGTVTPSTIQTSTALKNINGVDRTFGSWGEYAIAASGTITGMASGAGYSGGTTNAAYCDASLLTFSNATTAACTDATPKGNFVMNKLLPDISARFTTSTPLGANPSVNVTSIGTGVYSATGNVNLVSSGDIVKGKWLIINAPTATVTIKNNITYTNAALQSNEDIPQVIIIANNINIDAGVSRVDAWLVATGASGSINTCTEITSATQLNAGVCSTQLTVNGPVMARHLYLYRTAGAGTGADTGTPSEIFNLRPDAYLWATGYLATAGRLQTVSTKELPPRF